MTNQSNPAIDTLATNLLHANALDLHATLTALRALLTDDDFADLAATCDICPTHMTDIDTCRDDNLDCDSLATS